MFGIGLGEFILILVIALLFISPEKLPEIAKAVAKTLNDFKKASAEIRRTVSDIGFEEASRVADAQKAAASPKPLEGVQPPEAASAPETDKDVSRNAPSPAANEEKKGDAPTLPSPVKGVEPLQGEEIRKGSSTHSRP